MEPSRSRRYAKACTDLQLKTWLCVVRFAAHCKHGFMVFGAPANTASSAIYRIKLTVGGRSPKAEVNRCAHEQPSKKSLGPSSEIVTGRTPKTRPRELARHEKACGRGKHRWAREETTECAECRSRLVPPNPPAFGCCADTEPHHLPTGRGRRGEDRRRSPVGCRGPDGVFFDARPSERPHACGERR
jgi:hypothetical protein